MDLNVTQMTDILRDKTSWQATPRGMLASDYRNMIIYGIRHLLIDTGRASMYNRENYEQEDGCEFYRGDFGIDEEEYVLLLAEIQFFRKVQTDLNDQVSYTTDALSVTQGNKPFEHVQQTVNDLELERRRLYYKMHVYAIYTGE